MRRLPHFLLAAGWLVAALSAGSTASADTLDNLERERARLVALLTDPTLAPGDRQLRLEAASSRLRDLERMVMRDESLIGRNTPTVRAAFDSYELTFLLHAAAEGGVSIPEQWFAEVGLSTETVMSASTGTR